MDSKELLLELTSPLPTFDEGEMRRWASGRRIFISSTVLDLKEERRRTADTTRFLGATPRFFEAFSSPSDPRGVYVPEVGRADAVILVLGEHYGDSIPSDPDGRSATNVEYDEAIGAYKPVLIYRKENPNLKREPKLESFIRQLESRHTVARFHDLDELGALICEGILSIATQRNH